MARTRLTGLAGLFISGVAALAACGPSGDSPDARTGDVIDGGTQCTAEGSNRCQGSTYQVCHSGNWDVQTQCPLKCDDALGCVACNPGVLSCSGQDVVQCDSQGNPGSVVMTCSGTQICSNGACVDPCEEAATNRSYLGCEYWAVDLDNATEVLGLPTGNSCAAFGTDAKLLQSVKVCTKPDTSTTPAGTLVAGLCDADDACPDNTWACTAKSICGLDAQHSPFAIVVSNPQTKAVDVTISNAAGTTKTVSVAASTVTSIFPQQLGFADQSLDQSMKGKNAYKLTSTTPIVAYQFNPLDNVGVFSNDASLLLPRTTFDTKYYALVLSTLTRRVQDAANMDYGTNDYNGYVTIVAWQDGTHIDVTPTANVRANTAGGVAAINAGTKTSFVLDAYEVLNLESVGATVNGIAGPDLTGTLIESTDTKTFGVFSGTEASVVPSDTPGGLFTNGPCCADHLEEMMFPTSTWGKTFAIARSQVRLTMKAENDVIRVMAQKPGTTVTFTPSPVKGTCGSLDAGKFCQVEISADTKIVASEPILVGHYLTSTIWQDLFGIQTVGSGDPSLAVAVPVEQFRDSYAILVPSQYDATYVSLVVPDGTSVALDGTDVTGQLAAFGGGFKGGRVKIATAGPHNITCPGGGCGVELYGYSDAVSYMIAGGLDLKQIVIN
ncbi:MAG: IgGFc-binding protein [Deltaproteobacteria bacterium]|nr:IgGFc-binding protein [Deltaproteobacteria bacterium]